MSKEKVKCPKCNSTKHVRLVADYQKLGTAIGGGIGGVAGYYGKANSLVIGSEIGAVIGTALVPGVGTAMGALTGGVAGAVVGLCSGAAIGNYVGGQVDQLIAQYECQNCHSTFDL